MERNRHDRQHHAHDTPDPSAKQPEREPERKRKQFDYEGASDNWHVWQPRWRHESGAAEHGQRDQHKRRQRDKQ